MSVEPRGARGMAFLHGLDSSPLGTKSRFLRASYPEIWIPELPPDLDTRLRILEKGIASPFILIGSSWGGLTGLLYAMAHPRNVRGMLLLAPAVGLKGDFSPGERERAAMETACVPEGIPCTILAGTEDEVIPLGAVKAMIQRSPVPEAIALVEVEDDHNLHRHLDLMLRLLSALEAGVP